MSARFMRGSEARNRGAAQELGRAFDTVAPRTLVAGAPHSPSEVSMRSVWITRTGPPEVLEVRDGPDPVPGPGQVLIRVRASGVNFADVSARLGLYPDAPPRPCVVGYEVAGTIDRLGAGVDGDLAVGRRVIALTRFGGYAEAVAVPVAQVLPMPASLTLQERASI